MAFFNRTTELATITHAIGSPRAELVIVYGRRGSGKSELLIQAIAPYTTLYYQATTELLRQQLADMAAELRRIAGAHIAVGEFSVLSDLFAALSLVAQHVAPDPFVIVIDEFPYLTEAEPGTETAIQKWWDATHTTTPNLKVFLAGSHVSWMREHTLREQGPLQNRRTRQIEVLPLTYNHAALFYPDFSATDKIGAFAIWGGLPGYLRDIDRSLTLWDNVGRTLLDPDARLFTEPDWLRFTDLRADLLYTSLVRAIAMGQHTPSDLARAVGRRSAADIFDPLNRLIDIGIVVRVTPLMADMNRISGSGRAQYHLGDPFLAFWYRFIDSRRSMLRRGFATAAREQIMGEFAAYVARDVFETICRDWMWSASTGGLLPAELEIADVGTWWGGTKNEQDEIDVVALSANREAMAFGECKWSNAPMDLRDLGGLRHAIDMARDDLNPSLAPWRLCFSRSGFHTDLIAIAENPDNRVLLVDPELLYSTAAADEHPQSPDPST